MYLSVVDFPVSNLKSLRRMVAKGFSAAKADPVLRKIVLFIVAELKWHIQKRCLYILVETIHDVECGGVNPCDIYPLKQMWRGQPLRHTP